MISSSVFTFIQTNPTGVNLKQLQMPVLLSEDVLVSTIHEAFPISPPFLDDSPSLGLVLSDGSSPSYDPPSCSPQIYNYTPLFPQHGRNDSDSPISPTTSASDLSPRLPTARVLAEAPCAGGQPVKQRGGGYRCSSCDKFFKRRDDTTRHIRSAGMRVECRYCGKPSSGRTDGQLRHLRDHKACRKLWEVGYKAGHFTERSVQDAYYY